MKKKIINAIEMNNITMMFGTFTANDDVTLHVREGEVHALIGENGAGKSTLMSVLFGLYKPTSGELIINGRNVNFTSPLDANAAGIGMVHQHFKLVGTFTALENILLNNEITKGPFLNNGAAIEKINKIMDTYNFKVDLNKMVDKCTVAEQQRIEIIKMLYKDADLLIFDEPTAVLTPEQIKEFLKALKNLKAMGKTIIIISHKLDELKEVADRGTIIRRGKKISTIDIAKATTKSLAKLMVGTDVIATKNKYAKIKDNPILVVEDISVKQEDKNVVGLSDFNLKVNSGEIVAIAGVEGNGQTEIINAITGMKQAFKGKISLVDIKGNLEDITNYSIKKRFNSGIAHIPSDRQKHGSVLDMNMIDNSILIEHDSKKIQKFSFINSKNAKNMTQQIVESFDVRSSSGITSTLRSMSGGNQQKLIVGRELSRNNTLVVASQPTRGLDVGAINIIHKYILDIKKTGAAVLLISYELDEVLSLADRIVVVSSGKAVGEISGKKATKEQLGKLMATTSVKKVGKLRKVVKNVK